MSVPTKKALFVKAVARLEDALVAPVITDRDVAGIIQTFEFCYELSWKALQEKLALLGIVVNSPRAAFEGGFQVGLLDDSRVWGAMIFDRNLTTHTYNPDTAKQVMENIRGNYRQAFVELTKTL